jgi:hypothetical protein
MKPGCRFREVFLASEPHTVCRNLTNGISETVFNVLWSYVEDDDDDTDYNLCCYLSLGCGAVFEHLNNSVGTYVQNGLPT